MRPRAIVRTLVGLALVVGAVVGALYLVSSSLGWWYAHRRMDPALRAQYLGECRSDCNRLIAMQRDALARRDGAQGPAESASDLFECYTACKRTDVQMGGE